jgi:hypothetical protein
MPMTLLRFRIRSPQGGEPALDRVQTLFQVLRLRPKAFILFRQGRPLHRLDRTVESSASPTAVDAEPPPEAALHFPAAAARAEPADGFRCGA